MEREKFSSRLGFILISAGCAIGLGNVWRFPYITGKYGGAAFVILYLFFLVILGLPIMVMEFSVGRASRKSAALSFDVLEPKGTKWHLYKYGAMAGNYLLMMFYTTIGGWMLLYFFKTALGQFDGLTSARSLRQLRKAHGTARSYDAFHDHYGCNLLYDLFSGSSEGRGKDHQSYDGLPSGTDDRPGCPVSSFKRWRGRDPFLSVSGFQKTDGRKRRTLGSSLCSYGTVLLYPESWYRCAGYFRKLYRKRAVSYRRSLKYCRTRYVCGTYGRSDHFPGLLCLRHPAGQRS